MKISSTLPIYHMHVTLVQTRRYFHAVDASACQISSGIALWKSMVRLSYHLWFVHGLAGNKGKSYLKLLRTVLYGCILRLARQRQSLLYRALAVLLQTKEMRYSNTMRTVPDSASCCGNSTAEADIPQLTFVLCTNYVSRKSVNRHIATYA